MIQLSPGNLLPHIPRVEFCSSLHGEWGLHHARVPPTAVWWAEDPSVPLSAGAPALHLHQDIGESTCQARDCERCLCQADLYAGALFITKSTGFEGDGPIYISILILLAIACIFTVAGGLAAVIWTDFIQTVLMIIGAVVLAALGTGRTSCVLC